MGIAWRGRVGWPCVPHLEGSPPARRGAERTRWIAGARLALLIGLLALCPRAEAQDEGEYPPARPEAWELPDPDLYGVALRGDRVWAVGYWGTVLLSEDGGTSWARGETPTRYILFDVDFADDRRGWAVGETGLILHSRDGGRTWQPQAATMLDAAEGRRPLDVHLFGVSAVSAREAWAVGDMGVVVHTTDGRSWEPVAIPEAAFADEELPGRIFNAVRFPDADHGWIAGEFGTVLRTRDGGRTWQGERQFRDVPSDLYLFDLSVPGDGRAGAVGLAGNALVTRDGGALWQARPVVTSAALYGVSWRAGRMLVAGDRGELYHRADAGRWQPAERPRLFNWLRGVAQADGGLAYAVGERGMVLRSEDGGRSWRQIHGREPPPFSGVSVSQPAAPAEPEAPEVQMIQPSAEGSRSLFDPGR